MKSEFSEVLESPRKANKKRFLKLQLMIDTILETKCNVTLLLFGDTYWRGKSLPLLMDYVAIEH